MTPEPKHLVLPPARRLCPHGRPVHREHLVRVARQVQLQLLGSNGPHLQRGVLAAADHHPGIRGPRNLIHRSDVPPHRGDERAVVSVPELHSLVETRGRHPPPVRGEQDVVYELNVTRHSLQRLLGRPGGPHEHGEVVRTADYPLALTPGRRLVPLQSLGLGGLVILGLRRLVIVRPGSNRVLRRERQGVHPVAVAPQLTHHRAGVRVPYHHRRVPRGAVDEALAPPLHRRDRVGVRRERQLAVFVHHVPHPNGAVARSRRHSNGRVSHVRGLPGQRRDVLLVAPHGPAHPGAALRVPQPHVLVHAAARDVPSVRGPRDAEDPVGVARAGVPRGLSLVIPHAHGGVAASGREVFAVGGEGDGEDRLGVAGNGGGAARDGANSEERLGLVDDLQDGLHARVALPQVLAQGAGDLRVRRVERERDLVLVLQERVEHLLELLWVRVVGQVQLRARGVALGIFELRDDVDAVLGAGRGVERQLLAVLLATLAIGDV